MEQNAVLKPQNPLGGGLKSFLNQKSLGGFLKRKIAQKGFSLVELMISLIVISLIAAAFVPVLTKKLRSSSIIAGATNISEITKECDAFGSSCELCTKSACIICSLEKSDGNYIDKSSCSYKTCPLGCNTCESDTICTSCTTGGTASNPGYYLNGSKCQKCQNPNFYSDGLTCSGSCSAPNGYFCDSNNNLVACNQAYDSSCSTCDKNNCKSCNYQYYFDSSSKTCKSCQMQGCERCTSTSYCTQCANDYLLDVSTHKCLHVTLKGPKNDLIGCNCFSGNSLSYSCCACAGDYYLNSSKTCTLCSLEGCQTCTKGKSATNPVCESCQGGYYLKSGKCYTCSSKFGSNCTTCDQNNCLSCKSGYGLTSETTGTNSCKTNDNKFTCSDSNFMRIGNLCVTRKNMFDGLVLAPSNASDVIKANAVSDYCYSSSQKCCWLGGDTIKTASPCDAENGGYSGCNRSVCNYSAAKYICENFNYAGKRWRLPTTDEMENWLYNSKDLGVNGLQLCDFASGYKSAQCYSLSNYCHGSYDNVCRSFRVWTGSEGNSLTAYAFRLNASAWGPVWQYFKTLAFSVRCVTDMN